MKKFNYLYFGCMTLLWPGVDWLLSVLTPNHPAWLLLLPVYVCWYLLSAPLFYDIKLRQCRSGKGFKEGFHASYCMQAQWTTIWADTFHNKLAYLCMFNPFRIYYLPLDVVSNAKVEVHDSQDKEYIYYVNLKFSLYGKQNKIRVDTGGRGRRLRASANGRELVKRTSQFAEILNGSGNRNAK